MSAIQAVGRQIAEHGRVRVLFLALRYVTRQGSFATAFARDPDVRQGDVRDGMAGYARDDRRPHGAGGHDLRDRDVLQLSRGGFFLSQAAPAQPDEQRRANTGHGDP